MKFKLSLITIIFSLLLTTGCTPVDTSQTEDGVGKIETETSSDIFDEQNQPPLVEDKGLLSKITHILESGDQDLEITKNPSYELPAEIDDAQIDKYYMIDDVIFALVRRPSMNVRLDIPKDFNANFSGLIAADTTNKEWKKLFSIQDKEITNKNNPYAIWIDQKALYVSIVDQNGAGSGEGIAKIVKSSDLINWETDYCHYFGSEYRGPDEDGDYFLFSSFLLGREQSGDRCNNFTLILSD
jgi:hypothetical protein